MNTDNNTTPYLEIEELPSTLDFAQQKTKAMADIKRFFSDSWSNFNESDPGITILEQLLYGLTELGYCNDFSVEDILSDQQNNIAIEDHFLKPEQALMTSPVTAQDIIKIIIDQFPEVAAVYLQALQTESSDNNPARLTGSYCVRLATYRDLAVEQREDLLKQVQELLAQQRSLATLFSRIEILVAKPIKLQGNIGISDKACPFQLMQDIQAALSKFILPSITRFTYAEQSAERHDISTLFDGPRLTRGWLGDICAQMKQWQKIRVADLAACLSQLPDVLSVSALALVDAQGLAEASDSTTTGSDEIQISLSQIPRLILDEELFILQRDGINVDVADHPSASDYINKLLQRVDKKHASSLLPAIPQGQYRHLEQYYSLQNTFPQQYATGDNGLPSNASDFRIAQMRQLKAYLTLADRLLADQFAQLAHIPQLLSFRISHNEKQINSYATGSLDSVVGLADLVGPGQSSSDDLYQQDNDQLRNKILDHLLARHGEFSADFTGIVPVIAGLQSQQKSSLIIKSLWLQNSALLAYHRHCGFNYLAAKPVTSPGRYRVADNYAEILLAAEMSSESIYSLLPVIYSSYASQDKLKQAACSATGLADVADILPIIDSHQQMIDFDPFINGQLNLSRLEKNEKLTAQDIECFSPFELRLNLLTGLSMHYRLVATVLQQLISSQDFNYWLNSEQCNDNAFCQNSTGDADSAMGNGLEICVECKDQQHQVLLSGQLILILSANDQEISITDYHQHWDQLAWLIDQRKGSIFIEMILLLKSSAMNKGELNKDKLSALQCFLHTQLLLPSYLPQINTASFKQSVNKIITLYLPANVRNTTRYCSFIELDTVIQYFCRWHNSLSVHNQDQATVSDRQDTQQAARHLLCYLLTEIGSKHE